MSKLRDVVDALDRCAPEKVRAIVSAAVTLEIVATAILQRPRLAWLGAGVLSATCILDNLVRRHESRAHRDCMPRDRLEEIVEHLHRMAHNLRDGIRRWSVPSRNGGAGRDNAQQGFAKVMDHIAAAYSVWTGAKCAACLKLFALSDGEQDSFRLATFCRDEDSSDRRGARDGDDYTTLAENGAFNHIVNAKQENYFLSNDLVGERVYYNHGRGDWSDYYRSALVLAVQCTPLKGERKERTDLLGFLCVDSMEPGIFREPEMVRFGGCIADTMFWPLRVMQAAEGRKGNG